MQQALLALFATPSNNLKLFVSGRSVNLGNDGSPNSLAACGEAITEGLGLGSDAGCGGANAAAGGAAGRSFEPIIRCLTKALSDILSKEGRLACGQHLPTIPQHCTIAHFVGRWRI